MGTRFTITEQEKATIRGLYEQTAPAAAPAQQPQADRVFNIVKAMSSFKASGTITFTNDSVKTNIMFGKQDLVGDFHIDKKSNAGTMESYTCSGDFLGSNKHIFTILPAYKIITWESENPGGGGMRLAVSFNYK